MTKSELGGLCSQYALSIKKMEFLKEVLGGFGKVEVISVNGNDDKLTLVFLDALYETDTFETVLKPFEDLSDDRSEVINTIETFSNSLYAVLDRYEYEDENEVETTYRTVIDALYKALSSKYITTYPEMEDFVENELIIILDGIKS